MSRSRSSSSLIVTAIGMWLATEASFAQSPPPLTVPPAQTFPNEDAARTSFHLNWARELAGDDLYPHFMRRCVLSQVYSQYANSAEAPLQMLPMKVFDNLYFIGQGAVSAWAVKTSDGLVIIDTLNNASEAEYILVEGLRKLGLNPADVKYVLITHEHGDHYGGARYLQDTYHFRMVASDTAWTSMDNGSASRPRRDITIGEGPWTVGDTTFLFTITPGHTDGALSTILPVYDHGERHFGAIYGGWGIPASAPNKIKQLDSIARFGDIAKRAGVDVLLANHQTQDLSLYNQDLLRHRQLKDSLGHAAANSPNDFKDPHPYVIGKESYQRYLAVQAECVQASAARSGQVLTP